MSQTTTREDLRTEIRDNIQEASGIQGAIFTDALINRHIKREILSLPKKDVYKEESWTQTLDSTTDYSTGLQLPSNTAKVELVERNDGTTGYPDWNPLSGVDNYSGAIFFPYKITTSTQIRVKVKRAFTVPTDDVTALDIDDDIAEVIVWGTTVRLYRILIGYLRGSQSWDSVTKPGDLQITVIMTWIREAEAYYRSLIQEFAYVPRPREISLVD